MVPVTREQVAAMIYRFAQYQGEDVSASADLSAYPDGGTVSAYAVTPMRWAVGSGLISGTTGNRLDPQGTANRGQIAMMFMRLSSKG